MEILIDGVKARAVTAEIEHAMKVLEGLAIEDASPANHSPSLDPVPSTASAG